MTRRWNLASLLALACLAAGPVCEDATAAAQTRDAPAASQPPEGKAADEVPTEAVAATTSADAQPVAGATKGGQLPAELLGVWHADDEEGRAACARYRALPATLPEETFDVGDVPHWATMVGAMVVTPRLMHSYAEYGEGNFYEIVKVSSTGTNAWMLKARVGIDVIPDADDALVTETILVKLEGDRMRLAWPDDPREQSETSFRCGDVRSDLYGPADP